MYKHQYFYNFFMDERNSPSFAHSRISSKNKYRLYALHIIFNWLIRHERITNKWAHKQDETSKAWNFYSKNLSIDELHFTSELLPGK